MSRIGRMPITVPAGVTVTVDAENVVTVTPAGTVMGILPILDIFLYLPLLTIQTRELRRQSC